MHELHQSYDLIGPLLQIIQYICAIAFSPACHESGMDYIQGHLLMMSDFFPSSVYNFLLATGTLVIVGENMITVFEFNKRNIFMGSLYIIKGYSEVSSMFPYFCLDVRKNYKTYLLTCVRY